MLAGRRPWYTGSALERLDTFHLALKSELELFSLPPTQTTIEASDWVHRKPISSLTDDSPIEFVVPEQGDEYIDLAHTMLSIHTQIIASNVGAWQNEFKAWDGA